MNVSAAQLVPGCVLIADVAAKSAQPLLKKHTVLNDHHIYYLQKFMVKKVSVAKQLENGQNFSPKEITEEVMEYEPVVSFSDLYEDAVNRFKRLMNSWQQGSAVDVAAAREILLPLLKEMDDEGLRILALSKEADTESYFYHHSIAVALLAAYTAKKAGAPEADWKQLALAALLSDSGMNKLDYPYHTLTRELTAQEWQQVKQHPTHSYRLIEHSPLLSKKAKLAVLQHHERMDGSGYPFALTKEKIHPFAGLIAVCDMYHAMTCNRVFQNAQSPFAAVDEMMNGQFSCYNTAAVQSFVQMFTDVSKQANVVLSNGELAEIVFSEAAKPTKPMVKLLEGSQVLSLADQQELTISDFIY